MRGVGGGEGKGRPAGWYHLGRDDQLSRHLSHAPPRLRRQPRPGAAGAQRQPRGAWAGGAGAGAHDEHVAQRGVGRLGLVWVGAAKGRHADDKGAGHDERHACPVEELQPAPQEQHG